MLNFLCPCNISEKKNAEPFSDKGGDLGGKVEDNVRFISISDSQGYNAPMSDSQRYNAHFLSMMAGPSGTQLAGY